MIDIEPILRLFPNDRVAAAGCIGDAIAEGRISVPDDMPDDAADLLTCNIALLVQQIEGMES